MRGGPNLGTTQICVYSSVTRYHGMDFDLLGGHVTDGVPICHPR